MTDDTPPPGFQILDPASPHLEHLGPLWWRATPDANRTYGLRVRHEHLNNRGTAHGGVIATLADIPAATPSATSSTPRDPLHC